MADRFESAEERACGGIYVGKGRDDAQCEGARLAENLESELIGDDTLENPFACGQ